MLSSNWAAMRGAARLIESNAPSAMAGRVKRIM